MTQSYKMLCIAFRYIFFDNFEDAAIVLNRHNHEHPTDDAYREVASTNASRFVTRLIYMHTQNFLIRSPSWI